MKQNKRAHQVRKILPAEDKSREFEADELDYIAGGEEEPTVEEEYHPGIRRSSPEQLEYRRRQVLRLLLRSVPRKTIAEHLNVSMPTLYADIHAINQDMRHEVQNMDMPLFIGQTMAFFEEARSVALRIATDQNEPSVSNKINALRTALQAESEKHRYLSLVGLYNVASPEQVFPSARDDGHNLDHDSRDFDRLVEVLADPEGAEHGD